MNDVSFAPLAVVPPRRILRALLEWTLIGLLTVVLGGLYIIGMVACGCSLDFALGMLLGDLFRARESKSGKVKEKDNERALRLGRALRVRLGLDALARHRATRRQEATERYATVRIRLEQRRRDKALRRAEIARRMRYKLRQALLWFFAGIGALTLVAVLAGAVVRVAMVR